jgi:salicylate hydroxylase
MLDHLHGCVQQEWRCYSVLPEDKAYLGGLSHPKRHDGPHGYGSMTFRRPTLIQRLHEFAQKSGIEIKLDHMLQSLEQDSDGVNVVFANGVRERFSFVIGCDGLHSDTRKCLFGESPADYTGLALVRRFYNLHYCHAPDFSLSQWGGVSTTPEAFKGERASGEMYGNGISLVFIHVDDSTMIWA